MYVCLIKDVGRRKQACETKKSVIMGLKMITRSLWLAWWLLPCVRVLPHILSSVISLNNVLFLRPQRPHRRCFHHKNGINSLNSLGRQVSLTNLSPQRWFKISQSKQSVWWEGESLWASPTLFRCLQHPFYLSRWPRLCPRENEFICCHGRGGSSGIGENVTGTRGRLHIKNKILKLRFGFGITHFWDHWKYWVWQTWQKKPQKHLHFNTSLCYCALTGFNLHACQYLQNTLKLAHV